MSKPTTRNRKKEINTDEKRGKIYAKGRPYDLSVIEEEYKTMTQPQLAEKYGVTQRTIARWLALLGVEKRQGNWYHGSRTHKKDCEE